jgi:hypothetical protein
MFVGVFTDPLPRNSRLLIRLLHSNGHARCLFRGLCPATGLYPTLQLKLRFGLHAPIFDSHSEKRNLTLSLFLIKHHGMET